MSVEEFWNKFLVVSNLDSNIKYYEAFCFGGMSDEINDSLLELVLSGKKKATTCAYIDEEEYPHIGSYSIITNSKGEPKCVVQTTATHILRLKDMKLELAIKEGEGDSLDKWFFEHNMIFEAESKELGYQFSMDMPIFFEEFELVYKE